MSELRWWQVKVSGKVVSRSRHYWWYYWTGRLQDKWDVWRGNYDADGNWIGEDTDDS